MDYKSYLKSTAWKDIRTKKLFHNPRCYVCKRRKDLHVHHINYENLGKETTHDLKVLCKYCHKKVHFKKNGGKIKIKRTWDRLKQMKRWEEFRTDPKRLKLIRESKENNKLLDDEFRAIVQR